MNKTEAVAEAVRLIQDDGLSATQAAQQVADTLGVSGRTVRRWAQEIGTPLGELSLAVGKETVAEARAIYQARRPHLEVALFEAAEHLIAAVLGARVARDAQAWMTAAAIAVDKLRLEEGKATSRDESMSPEQAAEVLRAEVERWASDGASEAEEHANA